jgi:hypothetical protein
MANININAIVQHILNWLGIGICLHFGFKLGEMLDGVLTFI